MATGFRTVVVRSRGGQMLAAAVVAACLIPLVGLLTGGGTALLLRALPVVVLLGFGAVAVFWLPAVRIDPAAVEVRNVLRTTRVPWPAIEDVETRWSLVLVTGGRRVTAWAAPRGSAVAEARTLRRDLRAARVGAGSVRDPATAAGSVAATLVLTQWRRYRDDGLLGPVEGEGATTRWHAATIAVLVVLTVLAVLALL